MKEYEQAGHEDLEGEVRRRREVARAFLEGPGPCSNAPWLHDGVHSGARRLAACNAMKRIEARGKSGVIDTFWQKGIPLGAHRAFDPLHDPLYGPFRAIREMGFKDTFEVWCPHMASDVLTPMSLPLPGTREAGIDSIRYRLYAKGLVNVRSVVIAPVLNVVIADLLIRADVFGRLKGDPRTPEERREKLLETHVWNAVMSGALAAVALVGPSAPAAVVAYATTAAWSTLAAGTYYASMHRAEIEAAVRSAGAKAVVTAKSAVATGRKLVARPVPSSTAVPPVAPVAVQPLPPRPGAVRLGLAAAMLTLALASSRP